MSSIRPADHKIPYSVKPLPPKNDPPMDQGDINDTNTTPPLIDGGDIDTNKPNWINIHKQGATISGNTPADTRRRYYDFILKDSTADINFNSPTTARIRKSSNSDFNLDFSKYNDSLIIGENNTDLNVNANMGKGDDHVFLNPNATGLYDLKGGEGQDLLKFSKPLNSVSSLSITEVNGLPRYKFVMNGGATVIFKEFETIKLNNQTFNTTTPAGQLAFKNYLESLV